VRAIKGDAMRYDIKEHLRAQQRRHVEASISVENLRKAFARNQKRLQNKVDDAEWHLNRLRRLQRIAKDHNLLQTLRTRKDWKKFEKDYDDGLYDV
jgi:hypothetical protein